MSSLHEAIFERLYARYRNTFGEPLPIHITSVDDAIAYLRSRLRAYSNETARTIGARPAVPMMQHRGRAAAGEKVAA